MGGGHRAADGGLGSSVECAWGQAAGRRAARLAAWEAGWRWFSGPSSPPGWRCWLSHLHLFGQPAGVTAQTPDFLLLYTASLIPAFLSLAWKNHTDALGHPWPAFWIFLGGVLLNIGLNWLWIYGKWGFPALGVVGAGLGTLVARLAIAGAMLVWMLRSPRLHGWVPMRNWTQVTRAGFGVMLKIGLPASFGLLTEVSAFATGALLVEGWRGAARRASDCAQLRGHRIHDSARDGDGAHGANRGAGRFEGMASDAPCPGGRLAVWGRVHGVLDAGISFAGSGSRGCLWWSPP